MSAEAVLYVADLEATAEFYQRGFGAQRASGADDFCECRFAGWTLWLVHGHGVVSRDDSDRAQRRSQTPIKLCFVVASLSRARETIAALGGQVSEAEWSFGGYLRTDVVDLEGNVLQLLEAVELENSVRGTAE